MMKFLQKILPLFVGILISQTMLAQPFCNLNQGDAGFPSNPECETVICDDDPFCCESVWDGQCATSALEVQECQSCLAFCDQTYGLTGFEADLDCENAICTVDPFCCNTEWDLACATAAADEPACSNCLQSFCNESQGAESPGFLGYPDCEAAICAGDPFCCNTSWDLACASDALEEPACYPCFSEGTPPPPCEINQIANAIPENEDCGEDNNGGCNMTTPSFDQIYCGQTIAGTGWADGGTRDTDWYQFDLEEAGEVSIIVETSFPVFVGIDENFIDCNDGFTIDFSESGDYCSEVVLTASLSEGSHMLFVAPASFEDYPCTGDNTEYNVTLEADLCETIYCNQNLSIAGFPTNTECQQAVCNGDPFCCESSWDGLCAGDALLLDECTDCIAYCDQPLDIAGFPMDQDCETAVCDLDGFCCNNTWDGVCAGLAYVTEECSFCLSPIVPVDPCSPFDIPAGATAELEGCLESTNNGCEFGTFSSSEPLSCGETINGTLWAHNDTFDQDWFEFELGSDAEVTVSGSALMPAEFFIVDVPMGDCSAGSVISSSTGAECTTISTSAPLTAGTYYVAITPTVMEGYQCGSGSNDYYITLDIASETPEITSDADLDLCSGESVTLTASAGASYEWAPGGETSQAITVSTAGTYSVTVTDGNGCVNTSANVEVTENEEPTATILGGGSVCEGSTADVQINFTGSAPWSVAITNSTDNETFDNVTENPLTVPIGEPGSWTISAFSDANCDGVGSGSAEILEDCGCEAEPGSLTAVQTPVCLDPVNGTATIEATVNTAPSVPTGFETLYLLSEGSGLVIIDSDVSPTFEVDAAGTYTIHTLVYNPGTYDPNDINFGITTGNDVAENFVQGGGETCGALDAIGAQIEVEDCPCEADAGFLSPVETPVCLDEVSGTATIGATVDLPPNIPAGFELVYLLTEGTLIIMDTNSDPTFTVDMMGNYTIHTLVYDPATLDLSIIEFGVTSGFDINDLLVQGGGDICGALEVMGAEIEVCDDTGINERLSQQLSVFPNPSNGQFVVEMDGSVGQGSVRVADISGRRVFQRDVFFNGQFRLDVELNVAPGTYVLQVLTPEGSATRTLEVM